MPPTDRVSVRFPCPGESLRLLPLERQIAWYPLHYVPGGRAPCVGPGCGLCLSGTTRRGRTWEGYLLCFSGAPQEPLVVARLSARVWDSCSGLHDLGADLRDRSLLYTAQPARGAARLSLAVGVVSRDGPPKQFCGELHWPHVCRFWQLPADQPEYRAAVYFDLEAYWWPAWEAVRFAPVPRLPDPEGDQ